MEINCLKTVFFLFTLGIDILKVPIELKIDGRALAWDQTPVYLGVTLDRKLSMFDHVRAVREKASSKLNIVKRLASTTWGAKADVLRVLYLGTVRAQIDYSLPVQIYASATALKTLDSVQNSALRLICGTFRTAPIAALEIMANVPPLATRRDRAVITAFERYKRLEESSPLRVMVDSWQARRRISMQSFMHRAMRIGHEVGLSGDRLPLRTGVEPSPHLTFNLPEVRTKLIDPTVGKKSGPAERLTASLLTVQTYSGSTKAYTDGSVSTGAEVRAGYGALVLYPGLANEGDLPRSGRVDPRHALVEELSGPCGNVCIFDAEMEAIRIAVEAIGTRFGSQSVQVTDVVILTDALSVLQAIDGLGTWPARMVSLLLVISDLILRYGVKVVLQWIPSHAGVTGNEIADSLAKKGSLVPTSNGAASFESARRTIREWEARQWFKSWDENLTGRGVWVSLKRPDRSDPWWRLRRREQAAVAQFRTGHCPIGAYFGRFRPNYDTRCRHCREDDETVEHVLTGCRALQEDRVDVNGRPFAPGLYGSLATLSSTGGFILRALRE